MIRPVLDIRRADLRRFLEARGEAFREDATNADVSIPRNRVRHELIPYIESRFSHVASELLAGRRHWRATTRTFFGSLQSKASVESSFKRKRLGTAGGSGHSDLGFLGPRTSDFGGTSVWISMQRRWQRCLVRWHRGRHTTCSGDSAAPGKSGAITWSGSLPLPRWRTKALQPVCLGNTLRGWVVSSG